MLSAEIIINQRNWAFDQTFTYLVPNFLETRITPGHRVLVPLGKRKVEGYVRSLHKIENGETLKSVIEVLDEEPVVQEHQFVLADWLAAYYLAPISSVLSLMVPRAKARPKMDWVILNQPIDQKLLAEIDEFSRSFISDLNKRGGTSKSNAIKKLGPKRYEQLVQLDLVKVIGRYPSQRQPKYGWVYKIRTSQSPPDYDQISRRAPRQAEILQQLDINQTIDCQTLEKSFPLSSIRSLEKQGIIERVRLEPEICAPAFTLSPDQEAVLKQVNQALQLHKFKEFLLHGVTGSGKTEVYINCALAAMEQGEQSIVLVPEIALTEHLVEQFSARIPGTAVLHSGLTPLQRYQEWKRISSGEVNLVLGTRSAIFAPLSRLGVIIIDEEQESTFKQDETPRYHAREVARFRCQLESAVLLLGSATPSLESFYRTRKGESRLLELPHRIEGAPMPQVWVEDMKNHFRTGAGKVLSPLLVERIQKTLDSNEQCILFLNRRGYSPMTICRECGMIATCPSCAVGLNYHEDIGKYICHYCNFQAENIVSCSGCGSQYLIGAGFGTQKVEDEVRQLFPNARVSRLDIDSSRRKGNVQKVLSSMQRGDTDILVGTQMVAKGLDFPGVSLVGIIHADGTLNLPDYRAGERTFQLLVQAAGRSGRGSVPGEVIVQSFQPDHPVIRLAALQDYEGFYDQEMQLRESLDYPPYSCLLRIEISCQDETKAQQAAYLIKEYIEERIDSVEDEVQVLGPAPCPVWKLRDRYRFQIILKSPHRSLLQSLGTFLIQYGWADGVRVVFDMAPGMMM